MLRYWSTQKWGNFDIEGWYFDIEAPDIEDSSIIMNLYRSFFLDIGSIWYWRFFDIEAQIHISISKNLQYRKSNYRQILKAQDLRYRSFDWFYWARPVALVRAGLLTAIAGCSSVLGTYCSVTISLPVSVYLSGPDPGSAAPAVAPVAAPAASAAGSFQLECTRRLEPAAAGGYLLYHSVKSSVRNPWSLSYCMSQHFSRAE